MHALSRFSLSGHLNICCCGLVALSLLDSGYSQLMTQPAATVPSATPALLPGPAWQAKRRSAHQTEWGATRYVTNAATGRVLQVNSSFVELCVNLNVPDANGNFQPADPSFALTAEGVEANAAAHKVRIRSDLTASDAIRVEKDGVVLASHPLCIGYFDPANGRSYMLAEITNSTGYQVSSSEIVFSNCFSGLRASCIAIPNPGWSRICYWRKAQALHRKISASPRARESNCLRNFCPTRRFLS